MKKILATLAVAGLAVSAACSAVDTPDTTSAAPVTTVTTASFSEARSNLTRFGLRNDEQPSRSVTRPVKPTVVKPVVKPKPVAVKPKPKVAKISKPHKVKKPVFHKKKIVVKKKVTKKLKGHKVGLSGIASCIAKYESGGNPRAQNRHSTASGLFQFINGTWNHFGGYARAMYAPVSVQLKKFYIVWNGGRGAGNWVVAHKCGW